MKSDLGVEPAVIQTARRPRSSISASMAIAKRRTSFAALTRDAAARANRLPAPAGQFAVIARAYVPTAPVLDGPYQLPDVVRK